MAVYLTAVLVMNVQLRPEHLNNFLCQEAFETLENKEGKSMGGPSWSALPDGAIRYFTKRKVAGRCV
jgi:hypothetical protein